jgi:hypothetical protein
MRIIIPSSDTVKNVIRLERILPSTATQEEEEKKIFMIG